LTRRSGSRCASAATSGYEEFQRNRWSEFNRLAGIAAEQAKSNGLTQEILADILAD